MKRLLIGLALLVVACSDEGGTTDAGARADAAAGDAAEPDAAAPDADAPDADAPDTGPAAEPIDAPPLAWTWVDFPDAFCDDGTPTGVGVNLSATSDNVLIFLNGGGACWDYQTCVQLDTSTHGPFGRAQFTALTAFIDVGVFNRNDPANPFRDWSLVFVPYCTGDVHAGNNVAAYLSPGGDEVRIDHVGHANVLAYMERLDATFHAPPKVVLSGSSAGGYGALFNYPTVRGYWPTSQVYLVDDSGPPLIGDDVSPALRDAWFTSWRIDLVLDPLCGATCRMDLSAGISQISIMYPNDRMALLSTLRDNVIRSYFGITPEAFETGLLRLSVEVLDPTPNFEYFFVPGNEHTMLGAPQGFVSNNKPLLEWLGEMVNDDAAWTSTKP